MTGNPLFHKRIAKYVRLATLAFAASATLGHGIANAGVVRPLPASGVSLEALREAVSVVPISQTIELPATPALQTTITAAQAAVPLDAQWVAGLMRGALPDMAQPLAWQKLIGGAAPQAPASPQQRAQVVQSLWRTPLHFEPNHGQNPFAVKFTARTPGYQLYALQDELVLALRGSEALLRMQLVGAEVNAQPLLSAEEQLQGRSNYYIGNDPSRWQTNVPNFGKLRYSKVYPGVDWVLYGNARQLEHDFVVAPGTDPSVIALRLQGADAVHLAADGQLVATLAGRELLHSAPVIYQNVNGERRFIDGRYVLRTEDVNAPVVGFEIAAYDQSLPLIIDPLVYFTFVGGIYNNIDKDPSYGTGGDDYGYGIAVDSLGSAYITGSTSTNNAKIDALNTPKNLFPITGPGHPTTGGAIFSGGTDAFVTRLDAAGAIIYSTYFGGDAFDAAYAIAVDPANNIYITGITDSSDFPTTVGAFSGTIVGSQDAFVSRIDSNGGLGYSSYLGGTGVDTGLGIAVNTAGEAFVTGYTNSSNFPSVSPITIAANGEDAFVTKISATATPTILYSVLTNWPGNDRGQGIVLDAAGTGAYITGYRNAPNADYVSPNNEAAFTAKVTSAGAISYAASLDGSKNERGLAIARDNTNGVYITGYTNSASGIATPGAFDIEINNPNSRDAFIAKYQDGGSFTLIYASYLGGNADDIGYGVAVDSYGNTYVSGQTFSPDFPMVNPDDNLMVKGEAFLSRFNDTGAQLTYSSFWGGSENDAARGLVRDMNNDVYMVGYTNSNYKSEKENGGFLFGTITPYRIYSGGADAFVAKFSIPLVSGFDFPLSVTVQHSSGTNNVPSKGTVTSAPSGIACPDASGSEDCKEAYATGTKVTLTASPGVGSVFVGWAQDCASAGTDASCTVTMDAAKNVVAYFEPTFKVTVKREGDGTITSSPAGINCGAECSATYKLNTVVSLNARAVAASNFTGWGGACSGTNPNCQVVVRGDATITATFVAQQHKLTLTKSGTGSGTVSSDPEGISCGKTCDAMYAQGKAVRLTATAENGSKFAGWSGGCNGTSDACVLTMTEAKNVTAAFDPIGDMPLISIQSIVTPGTGGVNSGRSVSFELQLKNQGKADEHNSFKANLYLSPDNKIAPEETGNNDIDTGFQCNFTGGVPLDKVAICNGSFILPAGLSNGASYYLGVYIDGQQLTAKRVENNGIVAAKPLPVILLTVNKSGGGSGTVTSSPIGINCTANCPTANMAFLAGGNTEAILIASAAPDSTFTNWSGAGCSGTGNCKVTVNQAQTVIANFTNGNAPPVLEALPMIISGDYNGDKRADIIWHQAVSGAAYGMLLNGFQITEQGFFHNEPNTAWRIVNNGDLNGSGKDQLIWWNNQTGQVYWMPMDGIKTAPGGTMLYQEANTAWQIVAVGDLNADQKDDLVWWNNKTGEVYAMLMDGATIVQQGMVYQEINTAWRILVARDFTGDRKADLLWRNTSTGQVYLMPMNGLGVAGGAMIYQEPDLAWAIVAANDLNGDGKADLVWWNNTTGEVYIMLMDGATIAQQGMAYREPDTSWQIVASGDYSGDGKADLLWRNSKSGLIYQMQMNGMTIIAGQFIYQEANQDWRIVANAGAHLPSTRRLGATGQTRMLGGAMLNPNAPRLQGIPANPYRQLTGEPLNSGSISTAP